MTGLDRRRFLGMSLAAVGGIFVPKYDKWFRQGSGLLTPSPPQVIGMLGPEWDVGNTLMINYGPQLCRITAVDHVRGIITIEWDTRP